MAAVARQALVVASGRSGQALGAEPAHGRADRGIVEVVIEDHFEDVVE
jgi:hypothetical protein